MFALLQNQRRRYVLEYLRAHPGEATVRELSEAIAARENGVPVEQLNYQQRKRIHTSLYQTHLPKMADYGVIDYDRRAGIVSLSDRVTTYVPYLDIEDDPDITWEQFYLGLSGLALVAILFAALGVPPFAAVPGIAYAVVLVTLLALLSLAHFAVVRNDRIRALFE
ncbi:MAG: DUF7344 domain-containing protein [Halobacteriota archaeon]